MTKRSVVHATFIVERTYDASPARVYAAWADPNAKARWFGVPEDKTGKVEFDFRVGGREYNTGTGPNGQTYSYDACYQDIVPNERIVYSYDMHLGADRISVSLGTVELKPAGKGTKLTYTEQGAFLDGLDNPALREQGTGELLDALGKELKRGAAA